MASHFLIHGALLLAAPLCFLGNPELAGEEVPEPTVEAPYVSSSLNRVEHFAITAGGGALQDELLGLVEWRERIVEGGRVLERDVLFAGSELTVRHVERLTADTQRLVWREAASGVGRSQIVEPDEESLLVVDWLRSGLERTEIERKPGTRFPLALLEALRNGEPLPRRVSRYWPLTRSVEELEIETRLLDGAPGTIRRLVELRRGDGSFAGSFLFDGDELEAFQWQAGAAWARRVTQKRYQVLRAQLAGRGTIEASTEAKPSADF